VHFGLGDLSTIDSIEVWWPDSTVSTYRNVSANSQLAFSKKDAIVKEVKQANKVDVKFKKLPSFYTHKEKSPSDIKITRTLLHELTRYGPCLETGDVNNDKLDDLFIGGESGWRAQIFIQKADGTFTSSEFPSDSTREDGSAHFFDWDGDNDLDLYVAGACSSSGSNASTHLVYENDGRGNFHQVDGILPLINMSASCVTSADFDDDGDLDLFVGGRFEPGKYPLSSRSYILRNDNQKFVDVTKTLNSDLLYPGTVTDAKWSDVDKDGKTDLIIVGEWMPVRVFKNTQNSFKEITNAMGLDQTHGWWNCVEVADLNKDGYHEIIAGNIGMNSFFRSTIKNPVRIVAKDFDNSGSIDPVVTYYNTIEQERFIVHNRLVLIDQIPPIKKLFETFTHYATTPFESAFSSKDLRGAFEGSLNLQTSCIFLNNNGKKFQLTELPQIAQISTVNDVLADDLNNDGHTDLVLVGNNLSTETLFGAFDASVGCVMLGNGKLEWKTLSPEETGFIANKDAKMIKAARSNLGQMIIISNNNSNMDLYLRHK
jgi:hypothetical protein